ncbi:PAS domain S-box protein [Halorientalis pallida]|uniref:PAS domain S-box protein n=1 Tax=Halorientalis pallida TaxID=2479928 RepID=UPI003C705130
MADKRIAVVPEPGGADVAAALDSATDDVTVARVPTGAALHERLGADEPIHCVVTGLDLPHGDGLALLGSVRQSHPDLPFVIATGQGSERAASDAIAAGATDYVPLGPDGAVPELASRVTDAIRATGGESSPPDTDQPAGDSSVGAPTDRRHYETIVETVPDGVFVLDEDATIVSGNENGAALLGMTKADAIGTPIPQLVADGVLHQEVIEPYTDVVRRLLSDDADTERGEFQFRAYPGDDERIYQARVALRPYEDQFRGTIGVLRDVTERERRREELEQYETIIEAIPDAVWALDDRERYIYVNEALHELSGYERGESGEEGARIGMTEDGMERARELVRRIVSDDDPLGPSAKFEHDLVRKDGQVIPCETHIAVLPFDEEFRGTAGITRDISDRKRLLRRLEVINRLLRHNLRNDLTTVIEYADLVELETESASVAEYAQRINETAFDLVETSDKIRRVQKSLGTRMQDAPTVDLAVIAEAVLADVREQYPDATVETDFDGPIQVRGNESLRIALANLVENAIEHAERDSPTVHVEIVADGDPPRTVASDSVEPAEWVELRVADDGPGIPDHERKVVTGDAAVTQLTHSSGVGLWLVDWIATFFGGEVRIDDRPGSDSDSQGSVVVLSLRAE